MAGLPPRSDSFVASVAASIATGWSEPVSGRELHTLEFIAFCGALFHRPGSADGSVAVQDLCESDHSQRRLRD